MKTDAQDAQQLTAYEERPLTAEDLKSQVALIQGVMHAVMRDGEHYGIIPGCGKKPSLLKAGAEKLSFTFRFAPRFDVAVEAIDHPLIAGHREYRIVCQLYSITSGRFMGSGVGTANTMETKWRWRTGPVELTELPVPKEYWDLRKSDPIAALALLGGRGFVAKKNEAGGWVIARQGEKVEHENPADYYNTCLKMGKKRALVDAVLTATAASDIFTQDVEETVESEPAHVDTKPDNSPPATVPTPHGLFTSMVLKIDKTSGKSGDREWTRYAIQLSDKKYYGTFDKTIAETADRARIEALPVKVEAEAGAKGLTIKSLAIDEPRDAGSDG